MLTGSGDPRVVRTAWVEPEFFPTLGLAPVLRDPIAARGSGWLGMVARLEPGVSPDAARRELEGIADALSKEYPRDDASFTINAMPVRDAMVGDTRTPLLVLMASAGLVLLITCANLAGALLSRTITRRKEFAVRTALGAGQIALCVSLLAGAGLLVRSLIAMTGLPLGFEPRGVLTVGVQLAGRAYRTDAARAAFFAQLEERLRGLPGVSAVGDASQLPTAVGQRNGIRVVGAAPSPDGGIPFALYAPVSDDYFRALRIPLVSGRAFGPEDRPDGPPTAIVSQAMAKKFWPNGGALGGQFRMGPDPSSTPYTVVGIVGDVRNDPARLDAEPIVYGSARLDARPARTVVLRTSGDPLALVAPFRRELAAVDPGIPMRTATPLGAFLSDRLTGRRLPAVLMAAFGALVLLLASVGVYAMFAAMAAAREREFGVRVALGSTRREIATLVLRQGGAWMALGLVGGAGGVVLVARLVRDLLFGVRPFDPVVLALAVATLLACAAVALLVPVRRATRVDPIATLR